MARTKHEPANRKTGKKTKGLNDNSKRMSPSSLPLKGGPDKSTIPKTRRTGKMGRPTIYNEKKTPGIASNLCTRYGADNALLCTSFGISEVTLYQWMDKHPDFAKAIKEGKDNYDSKHVEASLLKRALGYSYTEVKTEDITVGKKKLPGTKVTETIKQLAPDPTSMIFWLKNRMPNRYRDVHKVEGKIDHNHKGKVKIDDNQDRAAEVLSILAEAGINLSGIDTGTKATTH